MKCNFRKAIGLFVLFFFCSTSWSQEDSTDLNFYKDIPELLTLEDSMIYVAGSYTDFYLEFEIDDTAEVGNIWVDFAQISDNGVAALLYHESFTVADLISQGIINDGVCRFYFGTFQSQHIHQTAIRMQDNDGFQMLLITKLLEP